MKEIRRELLAGIVLLAAFALWTVSIRHIDVQNAGPNGTEIGFAMINVWFHRLTGVHMLIYTITDWLGLVPIIICMCFGVLGLAQLIKRRSLLTVDSDILLYPSSTTLLVLTVMPTLKYQADRRIANPVIREVITVFVIVFTAFMVIGRLISGVHWATDIAGSVFLSSGLFMIYRYMADYFVSKKVTLKTEESDGVQ